MTVSKRQRLLSTVTTPRQLRRMKPEELRAHKTRPIWDKALSEEEKKKRKKWKYSEELPIDVDNLVEFAEQKLAEGKLRGFEPNARAIARRQGVTMKQARAILAASTRKASASAKRKNPNLAKVR